MISIKIRKRDDKLDFRFDIPLPSTLEKNPEMQSFLASLEHGTEIELCRDGINLLGFSINTTGWIAFMKNVLPEKEFIFHKRLLDDIISRDSSEQGGGLQVNFHQQTFDTAERYWNFILNQGNFIHYFLNRFNWYFFPRHAAVSPFPLHVDLESSSACNMSCPMCYRDQLKETGHMDIGLFRKAVNECAANSVYSIRLSWRGETLTHPQIEEMITYATSKIKNVSFLTNAFFIDEKKIDCFIKNRLSYIAVSFDGINDIYEAIRRPAKFKENYERLAFFKRKKEEADSKLPQVRLCTIWPAVKDDPDAYYDAMKDVSDYIVRNPYINFRGPMEIKPDFICQYPWERIVIGFNGDTQCCTGWHGDDIILGNIRNTSIYDMWHSDSMKRIRNLHAQGRRMELNSCAACRHGCKGDPNVNIYEIVKRRY